MASGNNRSAGSSSKAQNLTVKQERLARRAEKVEAMKREQAKVARNRRFAFIGGGVALLAIVGLVITFVVTGGVGAAPTAARVAGIQTFPDLSRNHVQTKVDYPQTPPVGGDHNPVWLNCGIYDQPVPNENAVHDLEHGAVWVTYDADKVKGKQLDALRASLPSTYAVLSPYPGLPAPVVVSAWGAQLQLDGPTDPGLADFITTYWQSPTNTPEPGAPCTGGLDAPGRVA